MTPTQATKFLKNDPSEAQMLDFMHNAKPGGTGPCFTIGKQENNFEIGPDHGYAPTLDGVIFQDGQRFFDTKLQAKAEAERIRRAHIALIEPNVLRLA